MAYSTAPVQATKIAASLASTGYAAVGGASAAAGGSAIAGALGAAIPFVGIAALAAPFISNLFQCGTIGTIGCQKRNDSTNLINARLSAMNITNAVATGALTASQGINALNQLASAAAGSMANPGSWNNPGTYYSVCGSFTNNGTAETGPSCNSTVASVIPNQTKISGPQMIQEYANYINSVTPPAGSPAASNPLTNLSASVGSTGIPVWALLAAGAAVLFLLVEI